MRQQTETTGRWERRVFLEKYYRELKQLGLQGLLDKLSFALGLAITVTDNRGRPLMQNRHLSPFCKVLRGHPEGRTRCEASRLASVRAATVAAGVALHTCHAGLVHIAAPLRVDGETMAVVLAGGNATLVPPEKEIVQVIARDTGLAEEDLLAAAARVPVWTEARLRKVTDAVFAVAATIGELLHARLRLQQKVDELTALFSFTRTVSASLDVSQVATRALEAVLALTGATSGSVMMLPEPLREGGKAEVAATVESRHEFRVIPTAEVIASVEKEGHAAHFDSRPGEATREEKRPAVALPLVVGGRVTGILTIAGKPKGARFSEDETAFLTTLGTGLGLALENARLYSTLRQHYARVVRALAAALEAKDRYTQGHSLRVAQWARACALHLGLSIEEQEHAYAAGLLHDVGKIGVSETVLAKPAPLTEEERAHVEQHPVLGAKILEPAGLPAPVIAAVRHHHEDYDGGGYPDGLAGEDIPLLARIIRVADAYDAMSSERPYRPAFARERAREELARNAGRQFDPRVVEVFLRLPPEETDALAVSGPHPDIPLAFGPSSATGRA